MRIRCCQECVPPKRHLGCHEDCEEYIKQKNEFLEQINKFKKSKVSTITEFDFKLVAGEHRMKKRRKR